MNSIVPLIYLLSAVCFILALKGLASPARQEEAIFLGFRYGSGCRLYPDDALNMHHHSILISLIIAGGIIGT